MDRHPHALSLDLIEAEARVCAPNYHPLPVVIERALDCHVWDVEGRCYLDMMGAYSAVSHGHLHPRIVAAALMAVSTASAPVFMGSACSKPDRAHSLVRNGPSVSPW
jgi:acetylornithine/succinyldiaminopimelate/putrescine aminotransferase